MSIHENMAASEYHAATGQYLTSSLLRAFLKSPRYFRDVVDGIASSSESEAMNFGTAFHALILEPEQFQARYAIKPNYIDLRTKEGKEWKAGAGDKEALSVQDHERMVLMAARMPDEISRILQWPDNRFEVTVRNKLGGFDAQARIDCWSDRMVVDIKTINSIERIEKAVWQMSYATQMRFYQRVIEAETGSAPAARLAFAETCSPYRWKLVEFDFEYIHKSDADIDTALAGLKHRTETCDWSDPAEICEMVSVPPWARDKEEARSTE